MQKLGKSCGPIAVRKLQGVKQGERITQFPKQPLQELLEGSRVHMVAPYVRSNMNQRFSELYRHFVNYTAIIQKESRTDHIYLVIPLSLVKVLSEMQAPTSEHNPSLSVIVDETHGLTQELARFGVEEVLFDKGEVYAAKEIASQDLKRRIKAKIAGTLVAGLICLLSIIFPLRLCFKR